ncbi:MAG: DUF3887 domain-containing protein [Bacteroidetes bacterium]|nr:DUF3887 domain-containing protein [Fibrella sp.]
MKRLTLLSLFCLLTNLALAQAPAVATSDPKLDSLAKLSQRYINSQQSDSLYALMGSAFKKEVSADQMKKVAEGLSAQLGKWVSYESTGVKDGIGSYKATFAQMALNFYISRDKEGKVETFLFKP